MQTGTKEAATEEEFPAGPRKLLFRSGATLAVTVVMASCSRRSGIAKAKLQRCHTCGYHSSEVRTGGSEFKWTDSNHSRVEAVLRSD